jgi:hypothetical protein
MYFIFTLVWLAAREDASYFSAMEIVCYWLDGLLLAGWAVR